MRTAGPLLPVILTLPLIATISAQICHNLCDNDPASSARNPRSPYVTTIFGREIRVYVSDEDNVAYAKISNGDPGDEVWLDRSFDGGSSWGSGSRLGNSAIPGNSRETTTPVFNIDGTINNQEIGVMRACGKPGNRDEIVCTPWTRSTVLAGNPAQAAATALMEKYNNNGQWTTTGWWNAANCLTAIIDYIKVTGDRTYLFVLDNTYEKNKNQFLGDFRNDYLDDTGWWGLAWVGAYDLTGDSKYLNTAKATADYMHSYIDNRCNGGVFWSTAKTYKNAITNELFIKLTAALHNRLPGDTQYLSWSQEVENWFTQSGMINNENLINDGLNDQCRNNGDITWTYNQGVILGGYVELAKATGNNDYLQKARRIADAAVASNYINPNGILHEPCDHDAIDCGGDGPSFKGVFARNIGELNAALGDHPYSSYIQRNADTIYNNRNSIDQYGLHYEGPFEFFSAATQHSAFEMLTSARRV